jgi:hypothetical protein
VSQQQKTIRILPLCHILVMLAIATWWGIYIWRHSPSRELFHLHEPTPRQAAQAARHTTLVPNLDFMYSSQGSRFPMAARADIGDLAWGGAGFLRWGFAPGSTSGVSTPGLTRAHQVRRSRSVVTISRRRPSMPTRTNRGRPA